MKLRIYHTEYWIKDDVILPFNFNYMSNVQKWSLCNNKNLLHKEGGPAVLSCSTRYQAWYLNGKKHRLDGPAEIWGDELQKWWLNNIKIDGEIYQKIQDSSKEELLIYMAVPKYKDYLPLIEYRLSL